MAPSLDGPAALMGFWTVRSGSAFPPVRAKDGAKMPNSIGSKGDQSRRRCGVWTGPLVYRREELHRMIHKLSFLRAKDGLTEDQFAAYWRDAHAEQFFRPLPGLRGYRTNKRISLGAELEEPVFPGVAESGVDDAEVDIQLVHSRETWMASARTSSTS